MRMVSALQTRAPLNQVVIGGSIFPHKPHGDPQTTEGKTRLITSASAGSSGGHGEMCE